MLVFDVLQKVGHGAWGFIGIQLGFDVTHRGADADFADPIALRVSVQGQEQAGEQGCTQGASDKKA
jgi:hypothetical protein